MKSWRLLLRVIGALNLALALLGCYAEVIPALNMPRNAPHFKAQEPFFAAAFWTESAISALFLLGLIIVSIMLLTLRRGAAIAHTCLFALLIVYASLPGTLWHLPHGIGTGLAGTGGLANLGTGLLLFWPVPFLYPLISTACVNMARLRFKKNGLRF